MPGALPLQCGDHFNRLVLTLERQADLEHIGSDANADQGLGCIEVALQSTISKSQFADPVDMSAQVVTPLNVR